MRPINPDDLAYMYPLEEFVDMCESGCFIDYDGFGYYSDGTTESDNKVYPSDIVGGEVDRDWTHVVWYNR